MNVYEIAYLYRSETNVLVFILSVQVKYLQSCLSFYHLKTSIPCPFFLLQ
jgi:hypothetical protein